MDDFVLGGRDEARARLTDVGRFLQTRLALGLNPAGSSSLPSPHRATSSATSITRTAASASAVQAAQ